MQSLFIFELDGITDETPEGAEELQIAYEEHRSLSAAEGAWLRAAEYTAGY